MQTSPSSILRATFGYDAFRGKQAEVIDDIVSGKHVLAIMPTGAGKSLCFQIPALLLDGLAIVVSPLISLMQNQVDALKLFGVEAATLNSATSPDENAVIWRKIQSGKLKLLYISPERLMTETMLETLKGFKLSLFAIDEAHCISQWGAAFRPEYEALADLNNLFPETPIIALAATADKATRNQIAEKIFAGNVKTYLTGFDRPNIALNVEIKNSWKQQLERFLKTQNRPANGIIYCLSRKKTIEVSELLAAKGYNVAPYHAGMSNTEREHNLNRFMAEGDLIIVATIAFGMGIDKPDIRFVFHTDLPSSPEAYYQEIGRAGRDGEPAVAHMLYGMQDIALRRRFIDNEEADNDHKRRNHQRLNSLLAYCEAPACRRISLLSYFGEEPQFEKCNNCDLCLQPRETVDATTAGRKFLSAVYRTGQSFGVAHIADILVGKTTPKIEQRRHQDLPTFGVGQEFNIQDWKSIARQLMARNFLQADVNYGSLKITARGRQLLKGEESFSYRPDLIHKARKAKVLASAHVAETNLPEHDLGLLQALKDLRREIATERSVPAYIIFSNQSLEEMAHYKPTSLEQFGNIHGVGTGKLTEFGQTFIEAIDEYEAHA